MAEKMLITQALDERDLLVKKIGDKIRKNSFIATKKHNADIIAEQKQSADPSYPQAKYDEELKKIKNGEIDGEKIGTMTIIIKATENATYLNLVDALDEMQICSVNKYVIDKITDNDKKLLKAANVKE